MEFRGFFFEKNVGFTGIRTGDLMHGNQKGELDFEQKTCTIHLGGCFR